MRESTLLCLLLACLVTPARAATPAAPATRPTTTTTRPAVLFFDSTYYLKKPDNLRFRGIHPAVCETWGTIEQFARRALYERAILILDLEPIPDYANSSDEEIERTLRKYAGAVDRARAAAPTLAIGCYHFPWNERESRSRRDDGAWDERGLTDRLNFTCPSVYLYRGQTYEQWVPEAERRLALARRFDRPVYAFLNVTHFTAPYEQVEFDLLQRAADFVAERSDAIIWWGGFYYEMLPDKREIYRQSNWDENANWLKVTLAIRRRTEAPTAVRPATRR